MSIIRTKELALDPVAMRDAYCETLIELAGQDEKIIGLDADVMSSMGTVPFGKAFPERSYNCGIQEANTMGMAAGLSSTGFKPFVHMFGVFATRRVYDQIFVSCAYAKLNVKIVGGDPGVTAQYNGGTHMPFEDLGIMRNIPDITIVEPTDATMIREAAKELSKVYGIGYVRSVRKNAIKVYEEGSTFEIGKAIKLEEGKDVTIIASGIMVVESIKAAELLREMGIHATVLDMFTIKPIDKNAIIESAKETGAIVTAENHNVINGLGSAVAEILGENIPVPMERVGVKDLFGEVGTLDYLKERFGLTAEEIVKSVLRVIDRKNKQVGVNDENSSC